MSSFPVSEQKSAELAARMARLGVVEDDLVESFIRGSGSGGQKVNKTSSCVQLLHRPSGLEVKCQRERSQAMNRYFARRALCEELEARVEGAKAKKQQEQEKIRRQKRRRSRRQKARMLDDKRKHSEKKSDRRGVDF